MAGKEREMTDTLVIFGVFLIAGAAAAMLVELVWGWHLGPLPKTRNGSPNESVKCRCRKYSHRKDGCPIKRSLGEMEYVLDLWLIQFVGPLCNFCRGDHRFRLD